MIYLGADKQAYDWKGLLKDVLESRGLKVVDLGVFDIEEVADSPDIAREVSEKVLENPGSQGVLLDTTGVGMMMAANKLSGIRAFVASDEQVVVKARACADANIICIGSALTPSFDEMVKLVDKFLVTEFDGSAESCRLVAKIN